MQLTAPGRPRGLGAAVETSTGGLRMTGLRPGTLADQLGLANGDLLVTPAGAPVTDLRDLTTIVRVLWTDPSVLPEATWNRKGRVHESHRAKSPGTRLLVRNPPDFHRRAR